MPYVNKNHPWGGWLAQPCQSIARWGGRGFDSRAKPQNFTKTNNQPWGATWQPMTGPRGTSTTNQNATCRCLIGPTCLPPINRTAMSPCHCHPATSDADVIRATCHPYSGDTCHPCIGPSVCQITYHILPCVVT
jgi:hypothetical protein